MRETQSRVATVVGMLAFFVLVAGLGHACKVPAIPVNKRGNLLCRYKDYVIFNGDITLEGDGARQFEEQLTGVHEFCRDPDVWCELIIEPGDAGD